MSETPAVYVLDGDNQHDTDKLRVVNIEEANRPQKTIADVCSYLISRIHELSEAQAQTLLMALVTQHRGAVIRFIDEQEARAEG